MAKKIERLKKVEEIRRKFPGKIEREVTKTGSLRAYIPTAEQEMWIVKNVGTKYSFSTFSEAIGISISSIYRILAKHKDKYVKLYRNAIDSHLRYREKKKKEEAKRKNKKIKLEWAWDIKEEKLRKKREENARKEQEEREKAELEEERLNHECYERRKDKMKEKTPIPFTNEEANLRNAAYNHYYILPDGEELLTERRKCLYWDNDTKRLKWIEEEADRLKFNVIEYRKMFPDSDNRLSSCKGERERFNMY